VWFGKRSGALEKMERKGKDGNYSATLYFLLFISEGHWQPCYFSGSLLSFRNDGVSLSQI
jgi:hypothetical protein